MILGDSTAAHRLDVNGTSEFRMQYIHVPNQQRAEQIAYKMYMDPSRLKESSNTASSTSTAAVSRHPKFDESHIRFARTAVSEGQQLHLLSYNAAQGGCHG